MPGGTAAGFHRRLALRARRRWHGRAARPGACGSPVAASRCALGDDGVGAARPGACMCPPRSRARCLLVVGMSRTSCASRCSRALCKARASRSCRGRGWGGVLQTSSCTSVRGNACMLPQHVQCESARRATATGAPEPPGQADPPHFERVQRAVPPHDRRHDDRHDDRETFGDKRQASRPFS